MTTSPIDPGRPLSGVRVLDLSRVLAGPYATQMLGDLGAEVWKVEKPDGGDETRAWGPPFVGEMSAYYRSVNRNKRSVALDFSHPDSAAALRRAAGRCDVVVENFLPGQLVRHGLDAASLRAEHPNLIVCSITGFGQDGPYAQLPGYDAVLQGFTGLMSITGEDSGPPTKVGVAVIDVLTGAHAAAAILAALVGRFRGAGGVHLDVALFEVGVASLVNVAQAAMVTGAPARRHGNAHPHIVPYQTFTTADGALVVAVGNDDQWRRLCEAIGEPEWGRDARWSGNPGRVLHREDVVGALAARFAAAPTAHWLARLQAARVPCGPVRDIADVVRDPALAERGLVSTSGGHPSLALPWRSDGRRPVSSLAPPELGAHTAEFMASVARPA